MLNQLPKNLNLSNSVNEKHLNLLDELPEIKTTQETSVTTNSENVFNFRISFFSKNKDLEQDIQKLKEVNKRITSMKMESIEKIEGTTDYKYVFNGVIDGR